MIPVQFYRQTGRYGDPVIKRAHTEETRQLDILSAVSDQSAPSMVSLNSSGHKNALGASTEQVRRAPPRAILSPGRMQQSTLINIEQESSVDNPSIQRNG